MIFCNYVSSSYWRVGNGKFDISNIDPNLCTHLAYAYFKMTPEGIIESLNPHFDFFEDNGLENVKHFNNLKELNPDLKTIAIVGDYKENFLEYFKVGADPVKRKTFIYSAIDFLKVNGFDGINLDWEWSALSDVADGSKYLITWFKEIREEFNKHDFILTITVDTTVDLPSFDISEVSNNVDFINLKTYSRSEQSDRFTSMSAPLYDSNNYDVDKAVINWLLQGAPASKLVLGVSFLGRTFTLANPSDNGVGAPSLGPGWPGPFTNETGLLSFNEICLNANWTIDWDKERRVPYGHQPNGQWVSFDNEWSVSDKVNYALDQNMRGIMVSSLDSDDFRGDCGKMYPLLKEINNVIDKSLYILVE